MISFGARCLNIRDVCMDFELFFEVYNVVSDHPKSIKLGQITALNVIVLWWCQFIYWLKFETRPSSLHNFGMAYDKGTTLQGFKFFYFFSQ